MRVLTVGNMYPPHHQGGYELLWRGSVEQLRAAGHEVRVLTTDHREAEPDPGVAEGPDVHRELRWYWRDHEFPELSVRERLRVERHNLGAFDRHCAEFEPEAVAWWAMGGMSMSLLERARGVGLPAVGVVVDEWLSYGPLVDGWQRAFGRPWLASVAGMLSGVPTRVRLDRAAEWIFVSAYLRERAVAAGLPLGEAQVVHAGIDPDAFPAADERPWDGRLLCLGRLDPRKGVATAVEALAALPGCTLRCVGAGDDSHRERLAALAAEGEVTSRVRFDRLPRTEIAGAYAAADALLFCVEWPEPFGLVPLEAMAVGTPVIATGTGGSAEYLADGENCLLVEPGDVAALAAAVERLAGDRGLRGRLRVGGLETAAAHGELRFDEAIAAALQRVAR
jgi:glycosyltransferase involved in cell wall biosynthesis